MPNDSQRRTTESGHYVTIDRNFVRNEAREAVRQFFRPITAPFESSREKRGQETQVKRGEGNRRS